MTDAIQAAKIINRNRSQEVDSSRNSDNSASSSSSSSSSLSGSKVGIKDECPQTYKTVKIDYFVGNGVFSNKIQSDDSRWIEPDIDVSNKLVMFRKKSLPMAKEKRRLCPPRLLSLNFYIICFNPDNSLAKFVDANLYDLMVKKYTNLFVVSRLGKLVNNWCDDLVIVCKSVDKQAYQLTLSYLIKSGTYMGLVISNILFHMVPRLFMWKNKCMNV